MQRHGKQDGDVNACDLVRAGHVRPRFLRAFSSARMSSIVSFPGLDELRHHRQRAPTEQPENVVEQPDARDVARDDRFEDVRVADLARAPYRAFRFKPVHGSLNRGIRGLRIGECLLDLADRRVAASPQRVENLQFQPGELRKSHTVPTT
jgi:hypothetical protein